MVAAVLWVVVVVQHMMRFLRSPLQLVQGKLRLAGRVRLFSLSIKHRRLKLWNLEQIVTATLEASLLEKNNPIGCFASGLRLDAKACGERGYHAIMQYMSNHSEAAYRSLVYGTEDFATYFVESTTVRHIAALNIGSWRRVKRVIALRILRAIPWTFSWAQCRLMIQVGMVWVRPWRALSKRAVNVGGVDYSQLSREGATHRLA